MNDENSGALDRLASKVADHSSVLQAMQMDIQHIVKAVERMVGVSEKQVDLGHQISRHSESIDRAFKHVDGVESKLAAAINALSTTLREDREADRAEAKADRAEAKAIAKTVADFQTTIRTLKYAWGGIAALLALVGVMFTTSFEKDITTRAAGAAEKHASMDADRLALGVKVDALSMQVQEVRIARQRDREANEAKP